MSLGWMFQRLMTEKSSILSFLPLMRDMSVRKMPMRESARRGRIASSGSSRIVRVTFTVIGSSFLMTIRPSRSAVTE